MNCELFQVINFVVNFLDEKFEIKVGFASGRTELRGFNAENILVAFCEFDCSNGSLVLKPRA